MPEGSRKVEGVSDTCSGRDESVYGEVSSMGEWGGAGWMAGGRPASEHVAESSCVDQGMRGRQSEPGKPAWGQGVRHMAE